MGGGIKWNWRKPVVDFSSCLMTDNYGYLYGNNFASFPQELVYLENETDYIRFFDRQTLARESSSFLEVSRPLRSLTYENVQSGTFIPTKYFALVDDEN